MSNAMMLRRHHRGLLEMAKELEKGLDLADQRARRQAVTFCLSRMTGLLALHLALEDKVMYPRLLGHRDWEVGSQTRRFLAEVGGFKEAFDAYRGKWMRPDRETAWSEFTADTRAMLKTLRERILLEEGRLYPLLERAGD